jgi:hypothetical protein
VWRGVYLQAPWTQIHCCYPALPRGVGPITPPAHPMASALNIQHTGRRIAVGLSGAFYLKFKLKLKLYYDRQSVGQSALVSGTHLGPAINFFSLIEIFFRKLRVSYFLASSLTRGQFCNLLHNCFWALPEQSLLGRSPAELTAIFYCLI